MRPKAAIPSTRVVFLSCGRDYEKGLIMPGEKTAALCKELTEEISSGKFAPLGVIPSERALMARFNVSRETVRKALRMLEEMGLVYASPGRGTFVSGVRRGRQSIGVLVSGCRNTESSIADHSVCTACCAAERSFITAASVMFCALAHSVAIAKTLNIIFNFFILHNNGATAPSRPDGST